MNLKNVRSIKLFSESNTCLYNWIHRFCVDLNYIFTTLFWLMSQVVCHGNIIFRKFAFICIKLQTFLLVFETPWPKRKHTSVYETQMFKHLGTKFLNFVRHIGRLYMSSKISRQRKSLHVSSLSHSVKLSIKTSHFTCLINITSKLHVMFQNSR